MMLPAMLPDARALGAVPIGASCGVLAHCHTSRASHDACAPGHATRAPPPPAHATPPLPRQVRPGTRLWGANRPPRRPRARLPANRPARPTRQGRRASVGPRCARSRRCRRAGGATTMARAHHGAWSARGGQTPPRRGHLRRDA